MQNNPAFQYFLSMLPKEKRASVVKEIVDAVLGNNEEQRLIENIKK
jgi:F0F1-type ATP synthase delta subunit